MTALPTWMLVFLKPLMRPILTIVVNNPTMFVLRPTKIPSCITGQVMMIARQHRSAVRAETALGPENSDRQARND